MVKLADEINPINILFHLIINDCDTLTLKVLEKCLSDLEQKIPAEQKSDYSIKKTKLLNYIKNSFIVSVRPLEESDETTIANKANELAKELSPWFNSTPEQLTDNVFIQLDNLYKNLNNYKWLSDQGLMLPQDLIKTLYITFNVKKITDLPTNIQQLFFEYKESYDISIALATDTLHKDHINVARLKNIHIKLITETQSFFNTQQAKLNTDLNQDFKNILKKAFQAYKKQHGTAKLLLLMNNNNLKEIFNSLKDFIPIELQNKAKIYIYDKELFNGWVKNTLASLFEEPAFSFSQDQFTKINKENNEYFSKDFSNDEPIEAVRDFRRDNHFKGNGFSVSTYEESVSVKRKLFQFAKNPILANFLLARGGQAQQSCLSRGLAQSLKFIYQGQQCYFRAYSTVATTTFDNVIRSDQDGDYLFLAVNMNFYSFFIFNDENSTFAVDETNFNTLKEISDDESKKIDKLITARKTPARPPVLEAGLQQKLYIESYAYKQDNKYFALDPISNKLVEITAEEFASIKQMLTTGKAPERPIIPLKMIPPEIAYNTAVEHEDILLGKIRIENISLTIDNHHKDISISPNFATGNTAVKKPRSNKIDEKYYQSLREELRRLKEEKKQLETQLPESLDKQITISEKNLAIIQLDLESMKLERHHYKSLFYNAHENHEAINPVSNTLALAEHQLSEYKLRQQKLDVEIALQQAKLKKLLAERKELFKRQHVEFTRQCKIPFIRTFLNTCTLLGDPRIYIFKKNKAAPILAFINPNSLVDILDKHALFIQTSSFDVNALSKQDLDVLITNAQKCIKEIDNYLASTRRSPIQKITDIISSKPKQQNDDISRTQLKIYRKNLHTLIKTMLYSEYYQLISKDLEITTIKTTDKALIKLQNECINNPQFKATDKEIKILEQSIADLHKAKATLAVKVKHKTEEIKEIQKLNLQRTTVRTTITPGAGL